MDEDKITRERYLALTRRNIPHLIVHEGHPSMGPRNKTQVDAAIKWLDRYMTEQRYVPVAHDLSAAGQRATVQQIAQRFFSQSVVDRDKKPLTERTREPAGPIDAAGPLATNAVAYVEGRDVDPVSFSLTKGEVPLDVITRTMPRYLGTEGPVELISEGGDLYRVKWLGERPEWAVGAGPVKIEIVLKPRK